MLLNELRRELELCGAPMSAPKIRWVELNGHLGVVPRDSIGNRVFDHGHLRLLIEYAANPPRKGRKPVAVA